MAAEPGKTCLREQALTAGNFKSSKIMYAIVDIAGQQFKVEAGSKIYVEGAVVKATVLRDDIKAKKVLVFKKIRRKGFQKLNGHRQKLTQIRIDAIA